MQSINGHDRLAARAAVNLFPSYMKMKSSSGYGKAEAGLYWGLVANGVETTLMGELHESQYELPRMQRLLQRGKARLADVTIFSGRAAIGAKFFPLGATRRWLYSMNECTKLTFQETTHINQQVERVLVPCPQLVDIYKGSGVRVPVHCIGTGVDMDGATFRMRRKPAAGQPFTWLTVSYGDMRKGTELALQAMIELFGVTPEHQLVIKARDNWGTSWLAGLKIPNVRVVGGVIGEAHWYQLLQRAHCFVFPSRGEGYGIPPREATLVGVPAIATRWLGMWDADAWGYGIGYSLRRVPIGNDVNADDGEWSEPDYEDLKAQMRRVYEDYDTAALKASAGRDYLLRESSFMKMGQNVKALLEEYA